MTLYCQYYSFNIVTRWHVAMLLIIGICYYGGQGFLTMMWKVSVVQVSVVQVSIPGLAQGRHTNFLARY